jgi:hypothetical protein
MLDRARAMLIGEVAQARGIRECESIVLLQKALSKAGHAFPEAA